MQYANIGYAVIYEMPVSLDRSVRELFLTSCL